MSSSTDKISLQENRIGDSSTAEATDTDGEVTDISDAVFEFSKIEICWPQRCCISSRIGKYY